MFGATWMGKWKDIKREGGDDLFRLVGIGEARIWVRRGEDMDDEDEKEMRKLATRWKRVWKWYDDE